MLPSPRGLHGRHGLALADLYNLCSSPWLPPAPLASLLLPKLSKFLLSQYLPGRGLCPCCPFYLGYFPWSS